MHIQPNHTSYIVRGPAPNLSRLAEVEHSHDLSLIGATQVEVSDQHRESFLAQAAELGLTVIPDRVIGIPETGELAKAEPVDLEAPRLELDVATRTLGVRELHELGFKGKGVGVAVLDTGIAPHPDMQGRIVAFHDEINHRTDPYDDHGHGTHVSGTVAGDGSLSKGYYEGVAPEASLIGVKVLSGQGYGTISGIVRGIQWVIENKDEYNIKVMNLSLGGSVAEAAKDDPMVQAIEAAKAAGILPVIAAGNSGPFGETIGTPGNAPGALTIGALNDGNTPWTFDDGIAMFSSRGPTPIDGFAKPDVVAPGAGITAPSAGGGYTRMSGTSMASPAAAGVAALLACAHPDATPDELKAAMMETADRVWGFSSKAQGQGRVDAGAAHRHLESEPAALLAS